MAHGDQNPLSEIYYMRWKLLVLRDFSDCFRRHFGLEEEVKNRLIEGFHYLTSTELADVIPEVFGKLRVKYVGAHTEEQLLNIAKQQDKHKCDKAVIRIVDKHIQGDREEMEMRLAKEVLDMYRPIAEGVEDLLREAHNDRRFHDQAMLYVEIWRAYDRSVTDLARHRQAVVADPQLQDQQKRPPHPDWVYDEIAYDSENERWVYGWGPRVPKAPLLGWEEPGRPQGSAFVEEDLPDREEMLCIRYGKLAVVHDYILLPNVSSILPTDFRKACSARREEFCPKNVADKWCRSYHISVLREDLDAVRVDLKQKGLLPLDAEPEGESDFDGEGGATSKPPLEKLETAKKLAEFYGLEVGRVRVTLNRAVEKNSFLRMEIKNPEGGSPQFLYKTVLANPILEKLK